MRIVLVSTAYPLRGGPAQFVALLAGVLERRGHKVSILSFRRQYPRIFFPGKTQKDEGEDLLPVTSHPLLNTMNPISWIRALLWLKTQRPDLIVFNYWMPFFLPCYATLAYFSRSILRIESLLIAHNIIPHEKKPGDRLITRIGLPMLSAFIVMSEAVRRDLLRFIPDALHRRIPHPVYAYFSPPVSRPEARRTLGLKHRHVLLFFGYIRPYKGVTTLIRALKLVRDRIDTHLLICGEFYEGREETLHLISELGLSARISVIDQYIPNEEVGLYFSAADVVVLPYLTATQSGIVKLAYYYNRPVIITRVGGLPEAVPEGRCGYVVPPADPQALADAIVDFFSNHRGPDFERHVRTEKTRYTWDRMAQGIETLAREAIRGRGRSD